MDFSQGEEMKKKFAFVSVIIAILVIAAAPLFPTGSYILVRYTPLGYLGGQEINVDLTLNERVVCTWDLGNTQPWDLGENNLYFVPVEGNCPSLDERNLVVWNVQQNYAEVYFQNEKVLEIPIWTTDNAGKYSLLQQK
jgi:hypothetical protein